MTSPLEKMLTKSKELERADLPPDAQGRVKRVRIVQVYRFKYPLLRVEETFKPDGKGGFDPKPSVIAMPADHILLNPERALSEAEAQAYAGALGGKVLKRSALSQNILISLPEAKLDSVPNAIAKLAGQPGVRSAEPDYVLYALATLPTDPDFSKLYGLYNTGQTGGTNRNDIHAPEAWDITQGSKSVIVAVIDTGIDYTHPDLQSQISINTAEVPGDGIDNDANGFVDDFRGWNFAESTNDPIDRQSHGTHCAGTIGAESNNAKGVVGVNWNVSLLPLKFLNDSGAGASSDAIDAVLYGVMRGAKVLSNSYGGGGYSQAFADAIEQARTANVVFVAAAGNSASSTPMYPAAYANANILSVAATDANDKIAVFSNYDDGTGWVDLAAPGVDIYSTIPGGNYGYKNGTSMAAPHVSGVCGLVYAVEPGITADDAVAWVKDGVDVKPVLSDMVSTGGRLNAYNTLFNNLNRPKLTLVSTTMTETNQSGIVNSGETVTLTAGFKNIGYIAASGVTATFSLASPDSSVTLTSTTAALGTIASRATVTNATPFSFTVSPSTPTPHVVNFNITCTDNATPTPNTWTFPYQVTVYTESQVSGTVRGVGGEPVAGATVSHVGPLPGSATTNAQGFYSFLVVDGGHELQATKTGYNASAHRLVQTPPAAAGVDLVLGISKLVPQPWRLNASTGTNGVVTMPITLSNPGNQPLNFAVRKMEYGYDSNLSESGPIYNWYDIAATGTELSSKEVAWRDITPFNCGPYPIGMKFPFYENRFSSFRLLNKGLISFTSANRNWQSSFITDLPDPIAPENLIAFAWSDELNWSHNDGVVSAFPDTARRTFYKQVDPTTFVITAQQWADVWGDLLTSQVVLKSDGTILLQYGPYSGWDGTPYTQAVATPNYFGAGMQDQTAQRGLMPILYDGRIIPHNGTVIRMRPVVGAPWLRLDQAKATLAANGGATTLNATFDATNLPPGTYTTKIVLDSNDAGGNPIEIPVTLVVSGTGNSLTWNSPVAQANVASGGIFTLDVQAQGDSDPITQVQFYKGAELLGTATAGSSNHYTYVWSNVPTGRYEISSVATHASGAQTWSPVRVLSAGTGLSVTIDPSDYSTSVPAVTRNRALVQRFGSPIVNFNTTPPSTFGPSADDVGKALAVDDGATLQMSGFAYKRVALPYTITPHTVIEFDFAGYKTNDGNDIFGIGMENDNIVTTNRIFQIWGASTNWGSRLNFNTYVENGFDSVVSRWQHYRIPIGQYYTGTQTHLVFVQTNNGDKSWVYQFDPSAAWRNVTVYEDPQYASDYTYNWTFNDASPLSGQEIWRTYLTPGDKTLSVTASLGSLSGSASRTLAVTGVARFGARVNFQPASAAIPFGYVPDSGAVYGDRGNGLTYGWNITNTTTAIDRYLLRSETLEKDTNIGQSTSQIWEIAVPNGAYSVRLMCGSARVSSSNRILVEGQQLVDVNLPKPNGPYFTDSVRTVTVTDGKLTVTSARDSARLNFMEITALAATQTGLPTASFTATPLTAIAPFTVQFDASTSVDNDGAIASYAWDFGDGTAASGALVSHNYTQPGLYTATLTVTDNSGLTDVCSTGINPLPATACAVSGTITGSTASVLVTDGVHSTYSTGGSPNAYTLYLPAGTWNLRASLAGSSFSPSGFTNPLVVSGALNGINFTTDGSTTYAISGVVTGPDSPIAGVTVTAGTSSAVTDSSGGYYIGSLVPGTYTVTPTAGSSSFTPATRSVTLTNADASAQDFATVQAPPTLVTPAAIVPTPVTGTTAALSVLAAHNDGEAALVYTWGTTGAFPGPVTFNDNGTNTAKNTTATFTKAGSYKLRATITDAKGGSVTSDVSFTVLQTLTGISVTPASAALVTNDTWQFTARLVDQFGVAMTSQPSSFAWSVSGGGTIDSSGNFTAGNTPGGPFVVTATSGGLSVTSSVWVSGQTENFSPLADTHTRQDGVYAAQNYGADPELRVDNKSGSERHILMKFDTSAAAAVTSAVVRLYAPVNTLSSGANNMDRGSVQIYPVLDTSWTEGNGTVAVPGSTGVTWNTEPAISNLYRGDYLAYANVQNGTGSYYQLDVTRYVQLEKAAGRHTVAFTLKTASKNNATTPYFLFNSKEASSNKPYLEMVYAPVNPAPTISSIADQSIVANASTGALSFTIGDAETAASSLTVTGSSSNQSLVPNANIVFGGNAASRTVTVTPATNQTGTATITLTVSDGALATSGSFSLTVTPNYASWISGYPGVGALSGPLDDPDGDGVPNLIEYALGTNPSLASSVARPVADTETVSGTTYFTLTYNKETTRTDITYHVQVSTDLSAGPAGWTDVADSLTGSTGTIEHRKASVTLDGPRKFLRLKITQP
jgi:subtilisin family serine protease/PKD repeat protein